MTEIGILLGTAITIAFVHTFIGIDHYIPFIALSGANKWTMKKTFVIVFVCGLAHVLSSVALGFAGIALSSGVGFLVDIESIRGEIATYFLIAFGLIYTIYGIRRSVKNKTHSHTGTDGHSFTHIHSSDEREHEHSDEPAKKNKNIFWGMMVVFVLGPCEPLIPIVMYPAATHNTFALVSVTAAFAVCTIGTMMLMTFLGIKGISLLNTHKLERYTHVLAGSAILLCGISILILPI